jgi:hypothetical protein
MDLARVQQLGARPLRPWLNRIDSISNKVCPASVHALRAYRPYLLVGVRQVQWYDPVSPNRRMN